MLLFRARVSKKKWEPDAKKETGTCTREIESRGIGQTASNRKENSCGCGGEFFGAVLRGTGRGGED